MRRKRVSNRALALTALAAVALFSLVWFVFADGSAEAQAAAIAIEAICVVAFLVIRSKNKRKARMIQRCELCRREMGDRTDDMAWAREYGLEACHECSFKMQVAFGNVGTSVGERILH